MIQYKLYRPQTKVFFVFLFLFFVLSVRLFVGSVRSSTSKDFLSQILPITFSYLNSWERASIFPFECSVLNKGTTGTIFITSSVWRGPWLGIEPGISRTRSQRYTTRLSRRRFWGYLRITLSVCLSLLTLTHH